MWSSTVRKTSSGNVEGYSCNVTSYSRNIKCFSQSTERYSRNVESSNAGEESLKLHLRVSEDSLFFPVWEILKRLLSSPTFFRQSGGETRR